MKWRPIIIQMIMMSQLFQFDALTLILNIIHYTTISLKSWQFIRAVQNEAITSALIFAAEYSPRSRILRINGFKRVRVHNGFRARQDFVDHPRPRSRPGSFRTPKPRFPEWRDARQLHEANFLMQFAGFVAGHRDPIAHSRAPSAYICIIHVGSVLHATSTTEPENQSRKATRIAPPGRNNSRTVIARERDLYVGSCVYIIHGPNRWLES